jgi:hypothetical protein
LYWPEVDPKKDARNFLCFIDHALVWLKVDQEPALEVEAEEQTGGHGG